MLFHLPGGAEGLCRGVGAPEGSLPPGPPQQVGMWAHLGGEAAILPLPGARSGVARGGSRQPGAPLPQAVTWGAAALLCLSLPPPAFPLGSHQPLGAALAGLLNSLRQVHGNVSTDKPRVRPPSLQAIPLTPHLSAILHTQAAFSFHGEGYG